MAALSSLKLRIAATIFVLEGLMMGFTLWQVLGAQQDLVEQQISTQEQVTLDLLKGQSRQALVTEEFTELQPVFEGLQRDRRIVRAVLADNHGRVVAASNALDLGRRLSELQPTASNYWREQEIGRGSSSRGVLALEFSMASLEQAGAQVRNLGILIAGIGMVLIALVGVISGWLLTRRLERLREAAQRVAQGDLTVRTALAGRDEIANLSQAFDQMAAHIAKAQERLSQANAELEQRVQDRTAELQQSLDELRRTQQQLVQSEKLAALGSLVAGVAHEINTPVGIGVTAVSFLHEKARENEALYRAGSIKRSDFESFIETAMKSSEMALSNLNRAADLISSFKMVAVDQASAKRRDFSLKDTLEEIFDMLHHLVKSRDVQVELDLAEGIQMDSYPGPLGQIITNLVNNALLHAFEQGGRGCIAVSARALDAELVELRFSDDGKGVAAENLGKIFDPFFTTKFGQGGSGLGLNIVHNLVGGVLGGQIRVESEPGVGTTFVITLPRVAPVTERAPA